jgi:hypothetical protein
MIHHRETAFLVLGPFNSWVMPGLHRRLARDSQSREDGKIDEGVRKEIEAAADDPRFNTPWKRLNFFWLTDGTSHTVRLLPDGKHRLTFFDRFRPHDQFADEPGVHELTNLYDPYDPEREPSDLTSMYN